MKQFIDEELVNSTIIDLKDKSDFDITNNPFIKKDIKGLTKISSMGSIGIYFIQSGDCSILAHIRGN